jgi:hypothetical protein
MELLESTAQSLRVVESAAWVSSAPFVSTSSTTIYPQPGFGWAESGGDVSGDDQ